MTISSTGMKRATMPTALLALAMLALAMLGNGCAPGLGIVTPSDAVPLACTGWERIVPSPADIETISDSLAEQLIAHDDTGIALGCWEEGP